MWGVIVGFGEFRVSGLRIFGGFRAPGEVLGDVCLGYFDIFRLGFKCFLGGVCRNLRIFRGIQVCVGLSLVRRAGPAEGHW